MTEVWAWRGPLVGRRVEIPEADVAAATAADGWAQKLEPGTELKRGDPNESNPAWKLPGAQSSPPSDSTPSASPPEPPPPPDNGGDDEAAAPHGRPPTRRR